MVKKYQDQKTKDRNFDARNDRPRAELQPDEKVVTEAQAKRENKGIVISGWSKHPYAAFRLTKTKISCRSSVFASLHQGGPEVRSPSSQATSGRPLAGTARTWRSCSLTRATRCTISARRVTFGSLWRPPSILRTWKALGCSFCLTPFGLSTRPRRPNCSARSVRCRRVKRRPTTRVRPAASPSCTPTESWSITARLMARTRPMA